MAIHNLESLFVEGRAWPPDSGRQAEYTENLAIRENRFNDCWEDLDRMLREDGKRELAIWLGYFWKSTSRTMDFLLGKKILVGSSKPDSPEDQSVKEFVASSDFHQTLYEVMVDCDSLGDGLIKIYKDEEGKSVIQSNSPEIWHVVVEPGNLRRVQYHVLATKFRRGETCYLKVEIHSKVDIEHRVYELSNSVTQKTFLLGKRLDFAGFSEEFPDMKELETHNLGEFLVIPVSNVRTSKDVYGNSSYNSASKSIAKTLFSKYADVDSVIRKHSDPNLQGPKGMLELNPITHKPMFRGGGRYFGYKHDPNVPIPEIKYITWDGNLVPAETAIGREIGDLFNELELPPVTMATNVVGSIANSAGTLSGTAYRLMLTPILAKCGRLERSMAPQAKKAIQLAMRYQGTPVEDVTIHVQDSMPKIPMEEAQRIMNLAASGLFGGKIGKQYLIEELGVPTDKAVVIAGEESASPMGF